MSLSQLCNCNFGSTKLNATGSFGVGYTLLDATGSIASARTTAGVYQTAPGIYAANVSFPDDFHGQILWDTGTTFMTASYATEQYNVEANDPSVARNVSFIRDMTGGRWQIESNMMKFYAEDNVTLVAEFELFDDAGVPTMDAVFERLKKP